MSIPSIIPHSPTYSFPSQRPEYRPAGADKRKDGLSREEAALNQEPKEAEKKNEVNALSQSEKDLIKRLKARDAEVRRHENAHLANAGSFALGSPSYDYQRGPDGRNYAVGGELSLDVSKVPNDPEATIQKMETVKRSALAPEQPSNKDRAVARQADRAINQAEAELRKESMDQPSPLEPSNPYNQKPNPYMDTPTISFRA